MALLLDRETPTEPLTTPAPTARRCHTRLVAAVGAAGVSLAVLVGRGDGVLVWRSVRALVVIGAALAIERAAQNQRRWGPRAAAGFGVVAVAAGVGFVPFLVKKGVSLTAAAAVGATVAGLAVVVAATVAGTSQRRPVWRTTAVIGAVVTTLAVVWIVAPAVAATNVPRPSLGATPASRGLAYESADLLTSDGVRLSAWYVPGQNRAAVIVAHGAGSTRSDVLDQAAVLARHGFGVLLVDARGHGDSDGRAMDFGWFGDRDIEAATRYLTTRLDVDSSRIAVMGMSMGGEEALGASASNPLIRAVVAEGATARSAADEAWLPDAFGWRGAVQEQLERVQDIATDLLTSASAPISNRHAVESAANTRYLIIAGGKVPDEQRAAAYVAAGAPDRVETWTVPGSGHTAGLRTSPEEWERRVITFLGEALNVRTSTSS